MKLYTWLQLLCEKMLEFLVPALTKIEKWVSLATRTIPRSVCFYSFPPTVIIWEKECEFSQHKFETFIYVLDFQGLEFD